MGLPDIDNIPDSGAVFTIGRSRFAENVASHFFIRQDPVLAVTCGDEHSAVVCQSGRLFVFGSNDWGQLGLGHKNHVSKPSCVKIIKPEKVTHVACGRAHTLICTGGQKIFACGSDQEGQLGRGGLAAGDSSSSPVLVFDSGLAGPRVLQIAAGSHHSMALTSDGGVVAWGSNLEGQLGLPGVSGLVNKPTKVPIPEPVKAIAAGYYHSAFLTESGLVYVCGESESGKLGVVINFSTQVAPKRLDLPGPAAAVVCGGHHTLVLGVNGALHGFGSNASGQLGMGVNVTEIQTPKLFPRAVLQGEAISKIACGESHTAIVTESGKMFTCGDGRHGKLGLEENENNVHELTFTVRYEELVVTNVACGGCHSILVAKRRGESKDDSDRLQTDVMQRKNSLPPLKIPLGRIQTEIFPEKNELDNAANNAEKNASEAYEKIENVAKSVKDETNNMEGTEPPNKISDHVEENSIENEESMKESANKTQEMINDTGTGDSKSEIDNNLVDKEMEQSAMDSKSSGSTKSRKSSDNNQRKLSTFVAASSGPNSSPSENQIPPPKPPRQKFGGAENVSADKELSSVKPSAPELPINSTIDGSECVTNHPSNENEEQHEESPKKSASSQKSDSPRSRMRMTLEAQDDAIENLKGKTKVLEGGKTEVTQDDSDVVQSPVQKTGRMAKLLKGKKHQEAENNAKKCGTTNSKPKSKTCTVL